jgi:hypothetical protein
MAGDDKARKDVLDSLVGWMENLEGASLEELRAIRRDLGHDVESSEESFLSMLREKSQEVGINLRMNAARSTESENGIRRKEPAPKKRLLAIAEEQGLSNAQQLAEATGLSVVLVKLLDRGLIDVLTIHPTITGTIASVLKQSVGTVVCCLQIPPRLAPHLQYKADKSPEVGKPQDFFEAVLKDPLLSDERREQLLALKHKRQ